MNVKALSETVDNVSPLGTRVDVVMGGHSCESAKSEAFIVTSDWLIVGCVVNCYATRSSSTELEPYILAFAQSLAICEVSELFQAGR